MLIHVQYEPPYMSAITEAWYKATDNSMSLLLQWDLVRVFNTHDLSILYAWKHSMDLMDSWRFKTIWDFVYPINAACLY